MARIGTRAPRFFWQVAGLLLCMTTPATAQPASLQPLLSISKAGGDLDEIANRGTLRVLVEYSHTRFFVDEGQLRGFEYELVNHFVENLRKSDPALKPLNVVYVPLPFDRILPALAEGYGDIAAAGISVTDKRRKIVDFSDPYLKGVREVVVAGKKAPALVTLADLSGHEIHVQEGTSYVGHLKTAAEQMKASGLAPLKIVENDLTTSSLLEMANAGIIDYTVMDEYAARLWSKVLANITVSDVALSRGGDVAWAVRKGTPMLTARVNDYIAENKKGSLIGNVLFNQYFDNVKWVDDPTGSKANQDRLNKLKAYFEAASEEQEIEWLLLAAQGYQESRLDQSVISPAGAVGVMQLLPSTANDPVVGGVDIHHTPDNILGGARYLRHLRNQYEGVGERFTPWAFAFAAYNAGPGRLAQARELAAQKGLDRDRWNGHVEYAMMSLVGLEPVRYVGNIQMYYIAYRRGLAAEFYPHPR